MTHYSIFAFQTLMNVPWMPLYVLQWVHVPMNLVHTAVCVLQATKPLLQNLQHVRVSFWKGNNELTAVIQVY